MSNFKADGRIPRKNLNDMINKAFFSPYFETHVRRGHLKFIQPRVLANLKKTSGGLGGKNSSAVAQNITSRAIVGSYPGQIFGGTGDIEYMDTKDPIFSLTNPVRLVQGSPRVRLWRLMEHGTVAKNYAIGPRTKSYLVFYWSKKGKMFKGKPGQSIRHPGFTGKGFFAEERKALYESTHDYYTYLRSKLHVLVRKYSA